jgi:hypothetical protein
MIACQQPMMLNSAIAFEKLVKNPKTGEKYDCFRNIF